MAVEIIPALVKCTKIKELLHGPVESPQRNIKFRPKKVRRIQDRKLQDNLRAGLPIQASMDNLRERRISPRSCQDDKKQIFALLQFLELTELRIPPGLFRKDDSCVLGHRKPPGQRKPQVHKGEEHQGDLILQRLRNRVVWRATLLCFIERNHDLFQGDEGGSKHERRVGVASICNEWV